MIPFEIEGRELANCNCAYGCPCQFNALPTHGNCETIVGYEITKGHFGDIKLDGLRATGTFWWPGPIRNPVTGEEHRARIDLPNGFEYSIAEMGSASGKAQAPIELEFKDTYGQFAYLHLGNNAIVK